MLEVKGLSASYGKHRALDGVNLRVAPGEIVVILGANGAGKSTLLKSIAGICEGRVSGSVTMSGEVITGLAPHKVVERGVALVPEGRGIFGDLTVRDNLMLGANPQRAREDQAQIYDRLIGLFPKLTERAGQVARTMSGGEQQMVAIGRAMMSNPVILMLDEPSLGLSPLLSKELFQNLKAVRAAGLGILLVEQNAKLSLGIADRGYLLENGTILREDRAEVLRNDPAVQAAYLGGGGAKGRASPVAPAPVAKPQTVTVRPRPTETVTAASVVGLDIEALVRRAGAKAAPRAVVHIPPASSKPAPASAQGAAPRSDSLRRALEEIEAAARKSRAPAASPLPPLRPSIRDRAAPVAKAYTPPPPPAESPPAPVAGKVDVWRRRPGSAQFDKMES
ncbi:MAG: ATP-binding cassette domain-containing protein [Roseinatronobacter sp.]|nr:ATP-binding cassette domain-containing protein [Roseinatronobacter sp.]